jgi:hypothetical protein
MTTERDDFKLEALIVLDALSLARDALEEAAMLLPKDLLAAENFWQKKKCFDEFALKAFEERMPYSELVKVAKETER